MPDSTKRTDDPFADLFGKLPDPRMRGGDAPGPRRTPSPSVDDDPQDGVFTPSAPSAAAPPAAPVTTPTTAAAPFAPAAASVPPAAAPAAPTATGSVGVSTGAVPTSRRAARAASAAQTGPSAQIPPAVHATTPTTPGQAPLEATAVLPAAQSDDATQAVGQPASAPQFADLFRAETVAVAPVARASEARVADAAVASTDPSLEDLFMGNTSADDIGSPPPPRNKRRRRIGGWIAFAIVLLFLGGIAAGGVWVWNTYETQIREVMGWEEPKDYAEGVASGEALVTVSSGDTGSVISQSLYDAGVTKTPDAFYEMLVDTAQNPTFYPGVYTLQKQMSSTAALAALQDPANKVDNTVVIPEGLIAADALQRIADVTGISIDELNAEAANYTQFGVPAEAPSIEGFIFPATYTFDPGVTAHDAIARMVNETFARLDALGVPASERLSVLTLASVIQKESGPDTADMNKIARVFLNRIDDGMPFQSDATVAYGAGVTGTVWTTDEQRADESNIYNTYVHPGLPPGPISNPGEAAILGARNPADGNWLYFVAVNLATGETTFSATYEEHLRAVDQLQDWCAKSENAPYCA